MTKRNLLSKKLKAFFVALGLCILCSAAVKAQTVSTYYTFSQSSGTYTPITGGTVLFSVSFDDGTPAQITIPSFTFNGTAYTSMYVDPNGFMGFGGTGWFGGDSYNPISDGIITADGILSPFGRDLENADVGTPEIRWAQVGNEIVIQYQDVHRYRSGTNTERFSFQTRLNTTTGTISFVYDSVSGTSTATGLPEVGLRGVDNTFPTNISNRTITTSGSWASSAAGTSEFDVMAFNPPTPVSGQTYVWTPASCLPPTSLTSSSVTATTATIGWTSPGGTPLGYQYVVVASGAGPYATPVATALVASPATSANLTSLSPGTAYDFYVKTGCSLTDTSVWSSAASFTTQCSGTPVGGTLSASSTSLCSGSTTSFSLSGYSLSTTLQFQSSPDSLVWTDINGATSSTYTATVSALTYYRVKVLCADSSYSNVLRVDILPTALCSYCVSGIGGSCGGEDIDTVVIVGTTLSVANNVCNTTSNFDSYSFYAGTPNSTATLNAGSSYTLNVSLSGSAITSVWIDYDQNGVFDTYEWTQVTTNATFGSVTLNVPITALGGQTIMRVRSRATFNQNDSTSGCQNFGSGETNDFVVTIATTACQRPTQVSTSAVTSTGATISWTASTSSPLGYIYTVVASGAGPNGTSVAQGFVTSPATSATVTGLSAGTGYDVYVKSLCTATDTSVWTNTTSFSTPCNGTPTAGVISSDASLVCAGENVTLTVSGYSLNTTIQWQSSTDSLTWTNIASATGATYTAAINGPIFFRVKITCVDSSFTAGFKVDNLSPALCTYCVQNIGGFCGGSDIDTVTILNTSLFSANTTCNTTANFDAYTFFSTGASNTANLFIDSSYTLQVYLSGNSITSCWIDYDQSGTFETSEWVQVTIDSTFGTATLTVPSGAVTGQTIMRVRSRASGNPNDSTSACDNFGSGETNDFIVNIVQGVNCGTAPSVTDSITSVACFGGSTGAVTLTLIGSGSYTHHWSNGSTAASLTGVPVGTYTDTITYGPTCTVVVGPYTVSGPSAALIATLDSSKNVKCFGQTNGALYVSVQGGTPSYTNIWSNGATSASLTAIGAGTYTDTITDANGCTTLAGPYTVSGPSAALTAVIDSARQVSCHGGTDGVVYAHTAGGTGSVTYLWSNQSTTIPLTGVGAGSYTLIATDANGCTATTTAQTLTDPSALAVSATVTNEFQGGSKGSITLSVSGGSSPYSYLWNTTATTASLSNLNAGVYAATITDSKGCQIVQKDTVRLITGIDDMSDVQSISVSPNPTQGKFNVSVILTRQMPVQVAVYSITGQLISSTGSESTSNHSYLIDLSSEAEGIYLVKMIIGDKTITKRLSVIR